MHPFSVLTLGIFVAGYITARWDLVTRLYELAVFAWDYGVVVSSVSAGLLLGLELPPSNHCPVQTRAAKGFGALTLIFLAILIPVERLATREANLVRLPPPSPYGLRHVESVLISYAPPAPSIARFRNFRQGAAEEERIVLRTFRCLSCQSMMG